MSLADDARVARERGLKFEVARKEARGARWHTVVVDVKDLDQAVSLARAVDAYESGVFVGGFMYWSSRSPEVLNSTVLQPHYHSTPVLLGSFEVIYWILHMRVTSEAKAQKVLRWFNKRIEQEITVVKCERHWAHREFFEAHVTTPLGVSEVSEAVFKTLTTCDLIASPWVVGGPEQYEGGLWSFSGHAQARSDRDWPIYTQIPGLTSVSFETRNYRDEYWSEE